jgi:hypothetical protein
VALTWLTCGSRSVGIVRLQAKTHGVCFVATQGTDVFVWKLLDSSLRILRTEMYCEGTKFIRNNVLLDDDFTVNKEYILTCLSFA